MSDNAFAYRRSNAFRKQLEALGARHILTPPYTPPSHFGDPTSHTAQSSGTG